MNQAEREQIDRMCQPRGLAIFGNMEKLEAFGHTILCAHTLFGYPGKIYPISHRGDTILGLPIYRSLSEVKGPVDLASISVPAPNVPAVLEECLAHGVIGATIHTSGFAESGDAGDVAQQQINAIAEKGLKIIGPNCFGIHCPEGGLTFLPGFDFPKDPGSIGMVFQSGGRLTDLVHEAAGSGIRFSKVFSFGNGCDLDAIKLMDYLGDDPKTTCIAAYLEGIHDGRRFLEVVRSITRRKPVVIWKGGLTPFGGRATMSHTGSMGGEAEIWKGALAQAGAIEVHSDQEMMDTLVALSFLKHPGKRLGIMGGGGAIGVQAADLAYRIGLEVPRFSNETRKALKAILPIPGAGLSNPIDMATPALPLELIAGLISEVLSREPIDVMVLFNMLHAIDIAPREFCKLKGIPAPDSNWYFDSLVDSMKKLKDKTGREIIAIIENSAQRVDNLETEKLLRVARGKFQENGIPVYSTGARALIGLKNALKAGLMRQV